MVELICPSCGSTPTGDSPVCPLCIAGYVPREPAVVLNEEPAEVLPEERAPARRASEPAAGTRPAVRFPWGDEPVPAGGRLVVGREKSPLAERLAAYTNVGRGHAEVRLLGDRLIVIDLDSTNGTWVNDERVAPMTPCELDDGDVLRFAAGLRATVVLGGAS